MTIVTLDFASHIHFVRRTPLFVYVVKRSTLILFSLFFFRVLVTNAGKFASTPHVPVLKNVILGFKYYWARSDI